MQVHYQSEAGRSSGSGPAFKKKQKNNKYFKRKTDSFADSLEAQISTCSSLQKN